MRMSRVWILTPPPTNPQGLVGQVVRVAKDEQRGLEFPGLKAVHLGVPGVEITDGG